MSESSFTTRSLARRGIWRWFCLWCVLAAVCTAWSGCGGQESAPMKNSGVSGGAETAEPGSVKSAAPPEHHFQAEKIDMLSLPRLRESDKSQFGLEGMTVNMLRGVTETRPLGQAIINLNRVMIGEDIPDSRARIIAIDQELGIAIEIVDTSERYYVPK